MKIPNYSYKITRGVEADVVGFFFGTIPYYLTMRCLVRYTGENNDTEAKFRMFRFFPIEMERKEISRILLGDAIELLESGGDDGEVDEMLEPIRPFKFIKFVPLNAIK